MTAQQNSADQTCTLGGFAPEFLPGRGKSTSSAEPSVLFCVWSYIPVAEQNGPKGSIPCQSKTSSSSLPPVQALPHVAIRSVSKPLAEAQSVPVQRLSRAAAWFRAQPLALVPTYWPVSPALCAATNSARVVTARVDFPNTRQNCPAQPVLKRGFSVPSRPRRTAHVQ